MAYNTHLEERIERILKEKKISFLSKKMMGGLTFMVDDKMCVGIVKDDLMLRVNPDCYEECLQKEGCRPMDFTKHRMKGFIFVDPLTVDMDEDLDRWIQLALDFNPKAKKSKR
ncbi:MAG: TfoX/Sxy family protein [Prolixibacteraceae bacterium]